MHDVAIAQVRLVRGVTGAEELRVCSHRGQLEAEGVPPGSLAAYAVLHKAGVRCFDVYQGKGIESGLKSIAFGLILQDNNRTLTDDEADGLVARIATALRQDLDARLRE